MSKFKTNDRVQYVGKNPAFIGRTGTVHGCYGPRCRVVFDGQRRAVVLERNLIPASPITGTRPSLVIYDEVGHHPRPPVVNVYDKGNGERLLGFLAKRPMASVQGRCLEMAVHRPIGSWFDDDAEPVSDLKFERVRFDFDYRRSEDGYSMDLVFRTDAPLKLLMQLPTFRLPGETDAQAERRRYA